MTQNQIIAQRYILREKLGQGGMGTVFRAYDRLTGHDVALKQVDTLWQRQNLSSDSSDGEDLRLALTQEFQTMASLRHPHIISVQDYGFDADNQPFFTMTLIEQPQNLREFAATQTLEDKIGLIIQILEAVAYLHRWGILHRDLKPTNILIEQTQVRVFDFGLAMERSHQRTTAGTLAYMAPEILAGSAPTEATDLYAIGVMAYEILAGQHPFATFDLVKLHNDILYTPPDLTRLHQSQVPLDTTPILSPGEDTARFVRNTLDELDSERTTRLQRASTPIPDESDESEAIPAPPQNLEGIVGKLLAKNPAQRYHQAEAVIHDLQVALGQTQPAPNAIIRESFLQAAKFVGRGTELQTLQGALASAIAGQGSVWLVGGESGVGKSRLLNELRTHALVNGVIVVRGQGLAGGIAYEVWRDVLPRLILGVELTDMEAGILKEIIPHIGELLGRKIPSVPTLSGQAAQERLILMIHSVLERQTQPILLIFEDLQWVHQSLIPLQRLLSYIDQMPLLIVGSYRHDERPTLAEELPQSHLLMLARLTPAAVAELSQSMLGEAGLRPEILDLMTRETEGNTFFMVEVARALVEEGNTPDKSLPTSIFTEGMRKILQRRLAGISVDYRHLLELAAVAGRQLDLNLLRRLAPYINLNLWLYQGQMASVFEIQENRWQFAHDKLREAVLYDLTNVPQLHQQVALAIEQHPEPHLYAEALMHHWQAAGDTARELHYLLMVAEEMVNYSGRYESARQLLEHGLTLATPPPSKLMLLLGACIENLGNFGEATRIHEEGLVLARQENNIQIEVDILNHIAYTMQIQSNYVEAQNLAQQAFKLAQQHGYDLGVATGLTISAYTVFHFQANYQEALRYFKEALAIYRQLDHAVGIAGVLRDLGILANTQGDYLAAIRYLSECLVIDHQIGTQSGISATLNNLGLATLYSGHFTTAQQHLQNALQIRQTIGDQRGIAATFHNLGLLAFYEADYDLAEKYHRDAFNIREKIKHPWGMAESLHNLANIARQQANFEQAVDYYNQSLLIYQRIKDQSGIIKTALGQITLQFQRHESVLPATIRENMRLAQQFRVPNTILIALVHYAGWQCQRGNIAPATILWRWLAQQTHYDVAVRQHAEAVANALGVNLDALPPTPPDYFATLESAVAHALGELAM